MSNTKEETFECVYCDGVADFVMIEGNFCVCAGCIKDGETDTKSVDDEETKESVCNNRHWHIEKGQLMLTAEDAEKQELVKGVVQVLEKQILMAAYERIVDWQPLENRRLIMKRAGSLDNALLAVQDICANLVLKMAKEKTDDAVQP